MNISSERTGIPYRGGEGLLTGEGFVEEGEKKRGEITFGLPQCYYPLKCHYTVKFSVLGPSQRQQTSTTLWEPETRHPKPRIPRSEYK